MAEATDLQVQKWSDERVRVRAEQVRNLGLLLEDDNGAVGSVYERLNGSGGWADERADGPPNLLLGSDILAFNALSAALAKILNGFTFANDAAKAAAVTDIQNQLAIVAKACVRGPM